jgi:hypothetical protein
MVGIDYPHYVYPYFPIYMILLTLSFFLAGKWLHAITLCQEAQTMYAVAQEEMPLYHTQARRNMQMPSAE